MPAVAVYCRHDFAKVLALDWAFDGVFAVRCRAPFEVLFVVDVGSCEEYLVSALVSRDQER